MILPNMTEAAFLTGSEWKLTHQDAAFLTGSELKLTYQDAAYVENLIIKLAALGPDTVLLKGVFRQMKCLIHRIISMERRS